MFCLCLLLKSIIVRVWGFFELKKSDWLYNCSIYFSLTGTSNIPIHFTKTKNEMLFNAIKCYSVQSPKCLLKYTVSKQLKYKYYWFSDPQKYSWLY